mgnify:CR=1 FL=1
MEKQKDTINSQDQNTGSTKIIVIIAIILIMWYMMSKAGIAERKNTNSKENYISSGSKTSRKNKKQIRSDTGVSSTVKWDVNDLESSVNRVNRKLSSN